MCGRPLRRRLTPPLSLPIWRETAGMPTGHPWVQLRLDYLARSRRLHELDDGEEPAEQEDDEMPDGQGNSVRDSGASPRLR